MKNAVLIFLAVIMSQTEESMYWIFWRCLACLARPARQPRTQFQSQLRALVNAMKGTYSSLMVKLALTLMGATWIHVCVQMDSTIMARLVTTWMIVTITRVPMQAFVATQVQTYTPAIAMMGIHFRGRNVKK
jgi:FtsH-binding integral membrane protein